MSKPEAFSVPDFENLYTDFKQVAVDYVTAVDSLKGESLNEALSNESELLTQVIASLVIKHQAMLREQNYWALQMFRKFVTETDMVDLLALQYGLTRQVVQEADDSVYPAIEEILESDEDLLRRFDLAPYQFHTTGTRLGYKFHALTLGERPLITIEKEDNAVIMRYEFPDAVEANPVKDADDRMLTPNSGEVEVVILSHETENGIASDELLTRVLTYLNRDDIAQESDDLTTRTAKIKNYTLDVVCYTNADPDKDVSQQNAQEALQAFTEECHRLGRRIDRLEVGHVLYALGFDRVEVFSPAADVVCEWDEAPFCTEVNVNVEAF